MDDVPVAQIHPRHLDPEVGMRANFKTQIVDVPLDRRLIVLRNDEKMFEVIYCHGLVLCCVPNGPDIVPYTETPLYPVSGSVGQVSWRKSHKLSLFSADEPIDREVLRGKSGTEGADMNGQFFHRFACGTAGRDLPHDRGLDLCTKFFHVHIGHLTVFDDHTAIDHDVAHALAVLGKDDLVHCVVEGDICDAIETEHEPGL